jgi:hypothetical protein
MIGGNNIMKLRKCSLFAAIVGALLLTAAFAPRANAILAVYYNFEDTFPDFTSEAIGLQTPLLQTNYNGPDLSDEAGLTGVNNNLFPGDPDANNHALGMSASIDNDPSYFQFHVNTNPLVGMSLSFAIDGNGNGFMQVDFQYSNDGFLADSHTFGTVNPILTGGVNTVSFLVPAAAEGQPDITFRLLFSGSMSQGQDLQNTIDNIRLDVRTVIPEPASVVGALLGACAICWNQRRRLIRFLPLRHA